MSYSVSMMGDNPWQSIYSPNYLKTEILSSADTLEASINAVLLYRYAHWGDVYTLGQIQWDRVQELHILGSRESRHQCPVKPGCYQMDDGEWILLAGVPEARIMECLTRCGQFLEKLSLRFTALSGLNLSNLKGLNALDLSRNESLALVIGLEWMGELADLRISDTAVRSLEIARSMLKMQRFCADRSKLENAEFLSWMPQLHTLQLRGTPLTALPRMKQFKNLYTLDLSESSLQELPPLGRGSELHSLNLSRTPVSNLDDYVFPEDLFELDVSGTPMHRIPNSIRHMGLLTQLNLQELKLDGLPDWLPDWMAKQQMDVIPDPGFGICMKGTSVKGMDASIFAQEANVIRKWFDERQKAKKGDTSGYLNEVKVVFLGDGEAGKTHCIARLLNDGGEPENFDGDSTPGIVINDSAYVIGGRHVQVHFWDFGGQEILHSMHRMFLTDRTLYVIIINARYDSQDDRARYWLRNVKSFANGAPVLLVLNKMDQNPNAAVNMADLRMLYPGLTEVVKLSAKYDDRDKFNTAFTEVLKQRIGEMENLACFFPADWNKVKQRLLDMGENYITGSDYGRICDENGITDAKLRRNLLKWFNDLGVSIYYGGNTGQQDYVILRPNWITNAVYAILFNKHPDTRNGIISRKAIFEMIQPSQGSDDPYRRTNSKEVYKTDEVEYILDVMRKFYLSFRLDSEREFIPALCQRESLPIAAEYAADPHALEFRMTFDYLPINVLHRLMVELRKDLDTGHVWRTGALFRQSPDGPSAVVKSEGNTLRIFARGGGANKYLGFVQDVIDRIVKGMKLKEPVNEVVYKMTDKSECFRYNTLVSSQAYGMESVFSDVFGHPLQIKDILSQTGHRAKEKEQKLLRDVYRACQQMQSQKIYWNLPESELRSKEDIRNDCIREALRSRKYFVSDQSRNGVSPGGQQAGRLDLDIRLESDVPWTIYEALNIRNAKKSDTKRWNDHLHKLLGPYNPNGLPFLFLVSYVDCPKGDFVEIWRAYYQHLSSYSPGEFTHQASETLSLETDCYEQTHYIQAAKSIYDCSGFPTTVYHIFVQLGN